MMNEKLNKNECYEITAFNADGKLVNSKFDSGFETVADCFNAVKGKNFTIREMHIHSIDNFIYVFFDENEKEI